MSTHRYDAIVIGAGMSGLGAGIRLAQYDKRVVVLERHSLWGGLNSFYKRGGRRYDHAPARQAPVRPGNQMALSNIRERLMLLYDMEAELRTTEAGDQFNLFLEFPYRKERRRRDVRRRARAAAA